MFLNPSQYAKARAGGRPSLNDWLQQNQKDKPDEEIESSSSSKSEDEDARALREEDIEAEGHRSVINKDPSTTWTGEETWPRLNDPPFSAKEVPLVLSEDPRVEVPSHIAKYLRTYQQEGVKFLYDKYRQGKGAILGDDMGLGKTVQITAFLIAVLGKTATKDDICTETELLQRADRKKPVIIVVPASVMQQVLITSYETYRVLSSELNQIEWEIVVFDEAHRIKNPTSALTEAAMKLVTRRRFGLTGTLLQNDMKELHCTMNWAIPNCLGSYKDFKQNYEKPIKDGQRQNADEAKVLKIIHVYYSFRGYCTFTTQVCEARDLALELKECIQKWVLRRDKNMIKDQVPGKEDWIVICPLTTSQIAVYDRLCSHKDIEILAKSDEPCPCNTRNEDGEHLKRRECCYRSIDPSTVELFDVGDGTTEVKWNSYLLPAITNLCKVCNHLDMVRVNKHDKPNVQARDRRFAQIVFDSDDPRDIEQQDDVRNMSSTKDCGKLQVLQELLSEWYRQKDKVLIFSTSVRMLNILEKVLILRHGYKYLRLDGSTPPSKRLQLVEQFNSSEELFVMIMSTKAGGLGVNLTSANVVVVIDPHWNPSYDLQAQDRAFRIGQRRHVKVYRFLAAGTIEEVIYQRQIYKQQLVRISMEASHERRYYTGVQGDANNQGELFGVANLFKWRKHEPFQVDVATKNILDREKGVSERYSGEKLKMEKVEVRAESDARARDRALEHNGCEEDCDYEKYARDYVQESVEDADNVLEGSKKKKHTPATVQSILESLSLHMHRHDEVIGESSSEAELHRTATRKYGKTCGPGLNSSAVSSCNLGNARQVGGKSSGAVGVGSQDSKRHRTEAASSLPQSEEDKEKLMEEMCRAFGMNLEEYLEFMSSLDDKDPFKQEMLRRLQDI